MKPDKIYYEPAALDYELGGFLKNKYADLPWLPIENHNSIEELRKNPNTEFVPMKKHLIIGVRKSLKYTDNSKISDYLVPYTSSGCSAMCLYCYLVCNYNKCSYLRLFVNREEMMSKLIRTARETDKVFEIGSNSDLILENTITGNLVWTIENFRSSDKGKITFPTKFSMVDDILPLKHEGKVIVRMSVNPGEIIKRIEIGTSGLNNRIRAMNDLAEAGYKTGMLIAPVVLLDNWRQLYSDLILKLADMLSEKAKKQLFIEIIFMTYSYVHRAINAEAFPAATDLYNKDRMTVRGMGKYRYKEEERIKAEIFLREQLSKYLKDVPIIYVS